MPAHRGGRPLQAVGAAGAAAHGGKCLKPPGPDGGCQVQDPPSMRALAIATRLTASPDFV
ncbi:hypothetical protein MCOR04_011539 [Pyricularia oryzae]